MTGGRRRGWGWGEQASVNRSLRFCSASCFPCSPAFSWTFAVHRGRKVSHCDSVARAEPAFYAKCSCVDPRLHRRTESQSYDRPDKIVYRINYLQNVASAPFRYADTHLPKFWPLSSYNLATRTFCTLTLMCFRKLEVMRMLIQLFF